MVRENSGKRDIQIDPYHEQRVFRLYKKPKFSPLVLVDEASVGKIGFVRTESYYVIGKRILMFPRQREREG